MATGFGTEEKVDGAGFVVFLDGGQRVVVTFFIEDVFGLTIEVVFLADVVGQGVVVTILTEEVFGLTIEVVLLAQATVTYVVLE